VTSTSNHAARLEARRAADALERNAGVTPQTSSKPVPPAKGGRYAPLNGVVDVVLRDMGEAELRVWIVLFRDVRGGVARTGMSDIARRAGIARRSVVRAIERLKARGLVTVKSRGSIDGRPNVYQLTTPT
jgi:CRP-like cAMP-binding protein